MPSSYRQYDHAELLRLVHLVHSKQLKWTEFQKLYDEDKLCVPPAQVKAVLYPKDKAAEQIKALEDKGLAPMGSPRQVRALPCSAHVSRSCKMLTTSLSLSLLPSPSFPRHLLQVLSNRSL